MVAAQPGAARRRQPAQQQKPPPQKRRERREDPARMADSCTFPNPGYWGAGHWSDLAEGAAMGCTAVRDVYLDGLSEAQQAAVFACVRSNGQPARLIGLNIGPCVERWTPEYLQRSGGDYTVQAQVCAAGRCVDIAGHRAANTAGNFRFVPMPFSELAARVCRTAPLAPVIAEGERYYLRSVPPPERAQREAAHLPELFPRLAADVDLEAVGRVLYPEPPGLYHSSVLRMTSADTDVWPHYDTMDNALIQVVGSKECTLWPPCCAYDLYTDGSSSRVDGRPGDPDTVRRFPRTAQAWRRAASCELRPGDCLYIPALWFHHTTSSAGSGSVAVNVFFRSAELPPEAYNRKDVYGNKPHTAGELAIQKVEAAAQALAALPEQYRAFYGARAAEVLRRLTGAEPADPNIRLGCRTGLAVVAGGTGAIGQQIALGLLAAGMSVLVVGRSSDRVAAAVRALRRAALSERQDPPQTVDGCVADLGSAAGCAAAASAGRGASVVVYCAATAPPDRTLTPEGIEEGLAVNVLGCHRLLAALAHSMPQGGRVVIVSSEYAGHYDLSDLQWERRRYRQQHAYQATRAAGRLLAAGWARRLQPAGVGVNACHPGEVVGSRLALALASRFGAHSPAEAAATPLHCALALPEGCSGGWYVRRQLQPQAEFADPEQGAELLAALDRIAGPP
eukprot:TRINITY_DN22078_c0_g1_i2.p1 TRINITY_DN22078_c0_g1~~TRINITY_DN22078_c0_g1_i2.p1  ORF type:complete len:786 (+),score=154.73 TRINITY_DN22078_c0_g1_i2:330-2360(+)